MEEQKDSRIEISIKNPDGSISHCWMDQEAWEAEQKQLNYMTKIKHPILKETPLDNRIIVLEDKAADKSAGGILLPNESTIKPYTGRVLAAGPQCEAVKLHDQVRYGQRMGDKIEIDGVEYLALRETDCYTILK